MIGPIAPADAEASGKRGGEAQNLDDPRALGGHAISSKPPDPADDPSIRTSGNVVGVRERMLRATLKLIADGGVAAVTNRRVAAAAGVSLGSLTYHFASQAQLLRESLLLHVAEETARREQIARQLAEKKPDVHQVAQAIEQLVAVPSEIPQQIAELELHLQAARDPELRDASRRCFEAHEQIASAALRALGIPDGERHAPAVVALMTGLAVRRLAAGGQDAQGTSEALLALVRGLEPR
ncbi:MAG TPA: TetR family transcriptional regulator [Solirubrobacteraceae bacterium]|jgi:AcrR family transcriptional regulator